MQLTFRVAQREDSDLVATLWNEAKDWLSSKGLDQWQYNVDRAKILNAIASQECWLAVSNEGDLIGTLTLDERADPEFWTAEDQPADALYVHRMIVRRAASGQNAGGAILDWAASRAALAGKHWLRLDAWRTNPRLVAYYSGQGFEHVRTVILAHRRSGALFQRAVSLVSPQVADQRSTDDHEKSSRP